MTKTKKPINTRLSKEKRNTAAHSEQGTEIAGHIEGNNVVWGEEGDDVVTTVWTLTYAGPDHFDIKPRSQYTKTEMYDELVKEKRGSHTMMAVYRYNGQIVKGVRRMLWVSLVINLLLVIGLVVTTTIK